MSIPRLLNNTLRHIPETNETGWGEEVTTDLTDVFDMLNGSVALVTGQALHIYPSTSTTLDPNGTLTRTHQVHKVQGNGEAVVLSLTVPITPGTRDGELLVLEGAHATNVVTVPDGVVQLRGDCRLGANETLTLRWDVQVGAWREETRSASHKLQNQLGLEFYELRSSGVHRIRMRAPDTLLGDLNWTLPPVNQVGNLRNDGSGVLTWDPSQASAFENVKSYGAVGDGVADDTVPIQAAINTVLAAGGGVVFFPRSIGYKITSSLLIPINSRNLMLYGPGTVIENYANAATIIIGDLTSTNNRAERVFIEGLQLNGRGATDGTFTAQNGIEIYACLGVSLRDVSITNMPQYGIVGLKSAASGSTYWNSVLFDHVTVRFSGKEGLRICKTGAAGDDLTMIAPIFNNLGKRLTTEPTGADAGVYINVATLSWHGGEVSRVRNENELNGFTRGALIRKASGVMSGIHFEDNCNNQGASYDLLLDTDANGLAVIGTTHGCDTTTSSAHGIRTTSKHNRIQGVRMDGGTNHVFGNIVDVTGATAPIVDAILDGGTPPSNKYVVFTPGTEALIGAVQGDLLAHQIVLPNNRYLRGRKSDQLTVALLAGLDAANRLRLGDSILATDTLFDSTGSIGIGTSAPGAKLHVFQVANAPALRAHKGGSGAGNAAEVENDGTGYALSIQQDGTAVALQITQNSVAMGARINMPDTNNSPGLDIEHAGVGDGLFIGAAQAVAARFRTQVAGPVSLMELESSLFDQFRIRRKMITHTPSSGTSSTISGAIPAASLVLGVSVRILTTLGGPTLVNLGTGAASTRYGNGQSPSANATWTSYGQGDQGSGVFNYNAATDMILAVATGANFNGTGSIRICIWYADLVAPGL